MQANAIQRPKTLTDKQRYWLTHVERCEATGGTMVAYASEQSLDLKQFYNWRMRLSRLRVLSQPSRSVGFKRVTVKPTPEFGTGCRIECPNGTRIEIKAGCDPEWVSLIFKAMSQLA